VLLSIRKRFREVRRFEVVGMGWIRRVGCDSTFEFDGVLNSFSGEIWWSSDPTAWRRFCKINRGETERMAKGFL
jgi:hypothetical protein